MTAWVAALVDNSTLVRIAKLREGGSGRLDLTTMLPAQEQARVDVYFQRGSAQHLMHTFSVDNLRRDTPPPAIQVSASVGNAAAALSLRVDGALVSSRTCPIPASVHDGARRPFVAAAAAILVLAGLGVGVWIAASPQVRAAAQADAWPRAVAVWAPPAMPIDDGGPQPKAVEPVEHRSVPVSGLSVRSVAFFPPESAELLPAAANVLELLVDSVDDWVGIGGDRGSIAIAATGHTARYGTEESRLDLSRRRAEAALRYLRMSLETRGVSRLRTTASGRAAHEPVTDAADEEWRNRRVEIRIETE